MIEHPIWLFIFKSFVKSCVTLRTALWNNPPPPPPRYVSYKQSQSTYKINLPKSLGDWITHILLSLFYEVMKSLMYNRTSKVILNMLISIACLPTPCKCIDPSSSVQTETFISMKLSNAWNYQMFQKFYATKKGGP